MKRHITLIALFVAIFSGSAMAQQYDEDYVIIKGGHQKSKVDMVYGIMAGVTAPRMSDNTGVLDVNNTAGFGIGVMYGVSLGGLDIVPEIWYQHDKSDIYNTDNGVEGELKSNSIEVPIIFAIKVGPLRVNVGPSFSLMSNSKLQRTGNYDELDFGRVKSTTGYVIGISSTIWEHLILDVRYTGRFVAVETEWYDSGTKHDYRYYNFGFNIGYRF